MPPKSKKGKISKAKQEAERIQAEEDERKAAILHAKREAERLRKEAEDAKRMRDEQIAERAEELDRLAKELVEAEEQIVETRQRLARAEKLEAGDAAWEAYTKCDTRPDAGSDCELNVYLSEGGDEKISDLKTAIERCAYTELIANDLLRRTGNALENDDVAEIARTSEFLQRLRAFAIGKINYATAHLLSHWDVFSDNDTEVDRTCLSAHGIRFGIWVNVSQKGFRIKNVDFAAAGTGTDIPRPLSSASIAVRNIFLPYRFALGEKSANNDTAAEFSSSDAATHKEVRR